MALHPSIGARPNTDGSGTSALAVRQGLAGLFTGPGVLPGAASPLVTGNADWTYTVGAAGFVTRRSASDGVHLLGNDGPTTVATTAAPGTGSRIDVVWVRQRSNGENGDTTSVPDFGVTQGTASGSPVKPSIPTGALELATATVAAGNANTAAATITQSAAPARVRSGGRIGASSLSAQITSAGGASYGTVLEVTGVSTGESVEVVWAATSFNGTSGADRSIQYRVLCDGVVIGRPSYGPHAVPLAGTPRVFAGFQVQHTPTAGAHTWRLESNASAAVTVIVEAASLTVDERV